MSRDVVIVGAARTPVGKFRGSLAGVRADHLGALVIDELATRVGVKPAQVNDVIFGCVTQIGERAITQQLQVARQQFGQFRWCADLEFEGDGRFACRPACSHGCLCQTLRRQGRQNAKCKDVFQQKRTPTTHHAGILTPR